jgi:hypothetical protein
VATEHSTTPERPEQKTGESRLAVSTETEHLNSPEPGVAGVAVAQLEVDSEDVWGAALGAAQRAIRPLGKWLAWLLVPPVIGLALIAAVAFNLGDSQITRSAGTASVALVIGALLLLGSAALYVFSPRRYDLFFTDLRKRLQGQSVSVVRAQAVAGASSQHALPRRDEDAMTDAGVPVPDQPQRPVKKKRRLRLW